jgi:L-arabinonolactonase
MLRIEVFSEDRNDLGEGPLWDVDEQRLYWIDSYGPAVYSSDLNGKNRKSWKVPEPIG